jgi:hypothetical protein
MEKAKLIEIDGKERPGTLLERGPGFEIYHVDEVFGWVVLLGEKVYVAKRGTPEYIGICKYLNPLQWAAADLERIKTTFYLIIDRLGAQQ